MIRHAIPYAGAGRCGRCPLQVCGGIIPDPDCPDHGSKKEPPLAWHEADSERCRDLARPRPRYRCASGHLLPADFSPPAREPDTWDDECRCKPPRATETVELPAT